VDQAGSGGLLGQAYTESFGPGNFSPAELNLGPARFTDYHADELTGSVPTPYQW
jgi:hypothetical protein